MADDPNADLIGYTFTDSFGKSYTVTETAPWSPEGHYVLVAGPSGLRTCRLANLVRARKVGEERDELLAVSA